MIKTAKAAGGAIKVTFVLPQDSPLGPVSVVGSFNDWEPGVTTLTNRTNGTRSASVTVPAGAALTFRYLGENGNWFDEPEADRVDSDGSRIET